MAVLSVQTAVFGGLSYTSAAASTADSFANDGKTFLLFTNANASARTLTIAANDAEKPGFGTIVTPDTVVSLPGSGTNGGLMAVGPFPTERFNDPSTGRVSYTIDVVTGLTVAAIKLATYA
ncbi:hypothetical protein [Zavarzinella formosa]|uniref:hypothetical protein n=1 Tax=Zavarzinella formosa TaxID=360055 RepID=UPI0002D39248|nr:hypothetical protein [Zavarzinella formosa]